MRQGEADACFASRPWWVLLGLCAVLSSCGGNEGKTGVALIIKTQSNPYFVSMKQAALAQAAKTGAHLSVAAGPGRRRHAVADQRHRHRHLARATRAS